MKPRGTLIAISGIDCAGKSTQIELLSDALSHGGRRVSCLWYRPGYSPELDQLRKLVRTVVPKTLPTSKESNLRDTAFSRPGVSSTWVVVALIDTLVQYALKVRSALWHGDTVICDRYIYDTCLDFELRFPELERLHRPGLRWVRRLSPTPNHSFLLMIPHAEMLQRMHRKNEPFPDTPDVRDARYAAYVAMSSRQDVTVIDAHASRQSIHEGLLTHIRAVVP